MAYRATLSQLLRTCSRSYGFERSRAWKAACRLNHLLLMRLRAPVWVSVSAGVPAADAVPDDRHDQGAATILLAGRVPVVDQRAVLGYAEVVPVEPVSFAAFPLAPSASSLPARVLKGREASRVLNQDLDGGLEVRAVIATIRQREVSRQLLSSQLGSTRPNCLLACVL